MSQAKLKLIEHGISPDHFLPSSKYFLKNNKIKRKNALFVAETTDLNRKSNKFQLTINDDEWPSTFTGYRTYLSGIRFVAEETTGGEQNDQLKIRSTAQTTTFVTNQRRSALGLSIEGQSNSNGVATETILNLGDGDDRISIKDKFGSLDAGVFSSQGGVILMGNGNNRVQCKGTDIVIEGELSFGNGKDILSATGRKDSTSNNLEISGLVHTGDGDDIIEASKIYISDPGITEAQDIRNTGIHMGDGDDILRVHSKMRFDDYAIYSNGAIQMGAGDDRIEGRLFAHGTGRGDSYPGYGSRVLTDFGAGHDTLTMTPGTYVVEEKSSKGVYEISQTGGEGWIMDVSGLETFESSQTSKHYPFIVGVIEII